jgi:two-component system, OmpR family, response regulator
MQIHIVEDDPILARGLQVNLELENHKILISSTIKAALDLQKEQTPDFIILDLNLPDGSGFDFLEKTRAHGLTAPIIILTAQTDEDSVVKGLQLGASDYMKKPYSFKELRARINVIIKKPSMQQRLINFDELSLNLDTRFVKYRDQGIEINRREFDILAHFVQRSEMIVTRDSLIGIIDKESEIFDRTIDSHISHLRKKLRSSGVNSVKISSVYGLGYRLERHSEK